MATLCSHVLILSVATSSPTHPLVRRRLLGRKAGKTDSLAQLQLCVILQRHGQSTSGLKTPNGTEKPVGGRECARRGLPGQGCRGLRVRGNLHARRLFMGPLQYTTRSRVRGR